MMNKTLYGVLHALRWLGWLIKYVFIWPAAMLMLLLIMLFWLDNTTPGTLMAEEIASVSWNAQTGNTASLFVRKGRLVRRLQTSWGPRPRMFVAIRY